MTAFILFVLATAEVQGFAFTLGIGVIVSLFTAVLATQAILMTMGDSRLIARPSALGAGGKKRVWRFDFMGASRYFFSMSGVILLIGALAIGGRGPEPRASTSPPARGSPPASSSRRPRPRSTSVLSCGRRGQPDGPEGRQQGARPRRLPDLLQAAAARAASARSQTALADQVRRCKSLRLDDSVGPTFGQTRSPTAPWSRSSPRCW